MLRLEFVLQTNIHKPAIRLTAPFSIALSLLAYLSMKWPNEVRLDVFKILFVGNLLHSVVLAYVSLYSSIRFFGVIFSLLNGALCFYRGKQAKLF